MTTNKTTDKVAIIGAGPAGLSVARTLTMLGIDFQVFEKHAEVGGIWDIKNTGSPMYRSAHFISSKTMSGHYGFPMPTDYPDYPSNKQVLDYIRNFADQYQLREKILFNTVVRHAEQVNDLWQIQHQTKNQAPKNTQFRWLVCASGTNWFPNRPVIKGEENFEGEIIHSVDYHDSDIVKNKKVLVVGAGNSGVDIACDAAFSADEAYISLRRGYHFIPKHIFGMPADVFGNQSKWMPMRFQQGIFALLLRLLEGDLTRLGLQKPDHKILSSHPIINSQVLHYLQHGDLKAKPDIGHISRNDVHFKDGSCIQADVIILATGYHWRLPYLDEDCFEWRDNRPQAFLKMFNPKHPTLFIHGYVETNGGAYKLFDDMAYLIANTIKAQADNNQLAERIQRFIEGAEPDLSGKVSYVSSERHSGYTNSDAFKSAMKKMRQHMQLPDLNDSFFCKKPKSQVR